MFWFIHALLGGIIGLHFDSITLVVLAAFISHFLLDMLPHWGIGFDIEHFREFYEAKITKKIFFFALLDAFIMILLLSLFYHETHSKLFLFGAIAALLPDLAGIGYFTRIKNRKSYKKYLKFHSKIQKEANFLLGVLTQIIILIILLFILL